jgi:hypothetical protein
MKNLLRWLKSTIKLQTSTLVAWLLVAPPILASDLQPGEYLNSTNNQSQQPNYQGYTQTQNSMDCGTYAHATQSNNYQQQSQQAWTPQTPQPIPPSYYGQVQTQQAQGQQNYNAGYQQPVTNVNTNAWRGAQPTSSESNTQNSEHASSNQNDPNSGATARAVGQVATRVLPMAAAMVGMGIMNKMRTGSMMGYPSYGGYGGYGGMGNMMGYGSPYGYGNSYGGYGGGYGGGGYGMNPMMNPMSRMGMGMGNPMMNMIHF